MADRFVVLRKVGEGGMGVVYAARDERDGSTVALKILTSLEGESRGRFEREAEALRSLDHPAIVRYVAHGEHERQPFLAMEWLEGEDLAQHLEREGPMSADDLRALARRLARGLAFVHERGLFHRDIKPGNIFLCDKRPEHAKWVDFGLAVGGRLRSVTAAGVVVGTPAYVAPERIRGAPIDARADVFSFGVVLWECVAGRVPYDGDPLTVLTKILLEEPSRLVDVRPEIGLGVSTLVSRMMAKNRDIRPADGRTVLAELEDVDAVAGSVSLPGEAGAAGHTSHISKAERRLAGLVVVGLAAEAIEVPAPVAAVAAEFGLTVTGPIPGGAVLTARPSEDVEGRDVVVVRAALVIARLPGVEHVSVATVHEGSGGVTRAIEEATRPRARWMHGGVRIDLRTEQLLSSRFERGKLDDATFVLGELDALDAPRRVRGAALPFVGREVELGELLGATDAALDRDHLMWVVVSGESGIGKSRLRQEALRALGAQRPDLDVVTLRGDPGWRKAPLGTISAFVRRLCGADAREPLARWSRLVARVGRHVEPGLVVSVAAMLADLAHLEVPEPVPLLAAARRDPLMMADRLKWAIAELLEAEVRARPVLLVLEDVQYVDAASIEMLVEVTAPLSARPLAIWAVGPSPFTHAIVSRVSASGLQAPREIELGELSPTAATALARAALGPTVSASDAEAVVTSAGRGVPLLIEEIATSMALGDAWSEGGAPHVEARLQALGSEHRAVLRAASLAGTVTWRGAIAAVSGLETDEVDRALDQLVEKSWLFERPLCRFAGERELSFVGEAACAAADALMVDEDRVTGHAILGRWLERMGEPDAAAIANHLVRGGAVHVAALHYARAAERALGLGDPRTALVLAGRGHSCGPDESTAAWLLVTEARARRMLGEDARAFEDAERAMKVLSSADLGRLDRWFDAARELVRASEALGRMQPVLELVVPLTGRTEAADAVEAEVVVVADVVQALLRAGETKRAEPLAAWLERTAPRFVDAPLAAAMASHATAWRAIVQRDFAKAKASLEHALELAADDADPELTARLLADLGRVTLELGEPEQAEPALERALELGKRGRATVVVARVLGDLGLARYRLGKIEEGFARMRESAALAAARALPEEIGARVVLARRLLEAGRVGEAQAEARLAITRAGDDSRRAAGARGVLAASLVALGNRPAASDEARQAAASLPLAGEDLEPDDVELLVQLAEVLEVVGAHDDAREARRRAALELRRQVDAISDERARGSFLMAAPFRASLLEDWPLSAR